MIVKTIFLAAALSIGIAGAALADQAPSAQPSSQSQVVMPNQRAPYLAHYSLAQNDVVMPNQRAQYLKHYDIG
jgi:hypothetical protein